MSVQMSDPIISERLLGYIHRFQKRNHLFLLAPQTQLALSDLLALRAQLDQPPLATPSSLRFRRRQQLLLGLMVRQDQSLRRNRLLQMFLCILALRFFLSVQRSKQSLSLEIYTMTECLARSQDRATE